MKKILSGVLASLMLLGTATSVFADNEAGGLTLADSSHLVLDTEKGYVDMIDGTITVADLKAEFASDITVTGKDGVKADDKAVATDDTVSAGDASLKALIYGDVDRNGKITLTDASGIMKLSAKWESSINEDAADVDKNGKANLADASKLLKFAAGWDDISLGNVRMVADNTPLRAENEDSSIDLYFDSSLVKVGKSTTDHTGRYTYKIKSARNETEGCQFFLVSDSDMEGLSITLSAFEHEYGEGTLTGEIFYEHYFEYAMFNNLFPYDSTNSYVDYFPEVLLPLADSFELTADKSQAFMLDVTVPKDAAAGMYKAVLEIKNAAGETVKCANVYLSVWDFTLPDTPYSASSFGLSWHDVYVYTNNLIGDDGYTYSLYYEFLLDHNISAYQLPYKITDPRAEAYMSDPRVTSFEICSTNLRRADLDDPNYVKAAYNKVQENPDWAEKGHFYYVDEPYMGGLEFVAADHGYLVDLLGTDDFNMVVPLASNTYANDYCEANNIDAIEYLTPYVNIWCPQSPAFQPFEYGGLWTSRRMMSKYGDFQPRYEALREAGNKMWWYICISPTPPYANYFTSYQGTAIRTVMWQQFQYDVDGILYWATTFNWGSAHRGDLTDIGDGVLLYVGEKFGSEGPVASWRLSQIRDSFDEFDYLRMAEELVGREEVMKEVQKITRHLVDFNEDPLVHEAARCAIAEMIIENQSK